MANQRVLVAMFDQAVATSHAQLIIFNGHLNINTDAKLIEVPVDVIQALRPTVLVHVEAAPAAIAERR